MVGGCGQVVFGLVTPKDGLVMRQDGLVTVDLLKKRQKFAKIVEIASKDGWMVEG